MAWKQCHQGAFYSFIFLFFTACIAETVILSYVLLRRFSIRHFTADLHFPIHISYLIPILIALTALAGWSGLKKSKPHLMKFFSILTAFTAIFAITLSIWMLIEKQQLPRSTIDVLNSKLNNDGNNLGDWDLLQSHFQCCGIHGPVTYIDANRPIPSSCCFKQSCGQINQEGCLYVLINLVSDDFFWVSSTLLIVALCQLPCVFLSWKFSNRRIVNSPKAIQLVPSA